jgi:hypothetical protein
MILPCTSVALVGRTLISADARDPVRKLDLPIVSVAAFLPGLITSEGRSAAVLPLPCHFDNRHLHLLLRCPQRSLRGASSLDTEASRRRSPGCSLRPAATATMGCCGPIALIVPGPLCAQYGRSGLEMITAKADIHSGALATIARCRNQANRISPIVWDGGP